MSKKSTQIALGGMFSALCLVLMFMTGLIPFSTYAIPALAGAMLVAVVLENGAGTAVLVYITVSVLSIFIAPDKEAVMMFGVFFGYYPIIKCKLDALRVRVVSIVLKLALFNAAIVTGYMVLIRLIGMPDLLKDSEFGQYTSLIMLLIGDIIFLVYDFSLTRYMALYVHWFKPRFLKRH